MWVWTEQAAPVKALGSGEALALQAEGRPWGAGAKKWHDQLCMILFAFSHLRIPMSGSMKGIPV